MKRKDSPMIRRLAALLISLMMLTGSLSFAEEAPVAVEEAPQRLFLAESLENCTFHPHVHTDACWKNGELVCGYSEEYAHTHTEECYDAEGTLICSLKEGSPATHTHGDGCYTEITELTCGIEEGEGAHVHTDACYTQRRGESPVCGLEESDGHQHTAECHSRVLICGQEESEGHTHGDSCYTRVLVCGLEETEETEQTETEEGTEPEEGPAPHHHTDECWELRLTCELEETPGHTHTDACYEDRVTCGIGEGEGAHRHTEDCYPLETVLTCGLEETEGHRHTDACYTTHSELTCTRKETHTHSASCFVTDESGRKVCVCGKVEILRHTHTAACREVRTAPAENGNDGEAGEEDGGEEDEEPPAEQETPGPEATPGPEDAENDVSALTDAAEEAESGEEPAEEGSEDPDEAEGEGDPEAENPAEEETAEDAGEPEEEPGEAAEDPEAPEPEAAEDPEIILLVDPDTGDPEELEEITGMHVLQTPDAIAYLQDRSFYNAFDLGLLPKLRNQGTEGACWAFANIGAIETDLIVSNLAGTDIDLSELYLAYYATHLYGPTRGDNGDQISLAQGQEGHWLSNGGYDPLAFRVMANMGGAVEEADAPYSGGSGAQPAADIPMAYQMIGAYQIEVTDRESIKDAIIEHGSVSAGMYANQGNYDSENNAYYYSGSEGQNHAIMLVGWDDDFDWKDFTGGNGSTPTANGAWLVRNSWWDQNDDDGYGYTGYFWISYEDAGLGKTSVTAYDADTTLYDNVYAHDQDALPDYYYRSGDASSPTNIVTVAQTFVMEANETIEAVGFEIGTGNLTADVTVSNCSGSASAQKKVDKKGYYQVKLETPLEVTAGDTVTLTIKYTGAGEIKIRFEKAEDEEYGITTFSPKSSGFKLNGAQTDGDARMKLYTRKAGSAAATSLTLNKDTASIAVGQSETLTASLTPNTSTETVTWTSSDPAVATVDKTTGKVTGVSVGEVTITAKSTYGLRKSCAVTVGEPVHVTSITIQNPIDPASRTATYNKNTIPGTDLGDLPITRTLSYTIAPENATNKKVTWTSSDPAVVAIESSSATTQKLSFSLKKNGTVKLTATTVDGGFTDSLTIVVNLPPAPTPTPKPTPTPVASISVSPSSLTLYEGENSRLTATVLPAGAADKYYTWSSSNTNVATVDSNGTVYGHKDGTAVITARTRSGGKTATCRVTVKTRDPVEAFVYRMYRVCLQRDPDQQGLNHWTALLKNGSVSGAEMANGFYQSEEMVHRGLSNGEFVERAYEGILGRLPDAQGKAFWQSFLDKGVSYGFIVSGFTTSQEYTEICRDYGIVRGDYSSPNVRDVNPEITGFASRLYEKALGRRFEEAGLTHWVGVILQNPTRNTMIDIATNGFLHSAEFLGKKLNDEQYIRVLYRTFLGREADRDGLNHWLGLMQRGMTRDELAINFAWSQEFAGIMGPAIH